MGKEDPTTTAVEPIEAVDEEALDLEVESSPIDTSRARRAIPRDAAIVLTLHTKLNEAAHLHYPIDPLEADRIFARAVNNLTDQMLLPVLTSFQNALQDGDLTFQCDTEPIAASSDRHASTLVRKRAKRKQSHETAVKTSIYGNYAPSRASSRGESRFDGSRFGGSRVSPSVRGASKLPKMSLIYGLSSWIGGQHGSTGNNASWLQGAAATTGKPSPPSSVRGTARMVVDFVELQRRADIECDLSTRESVRRSNDESHRRGGLRLKLRSLADPTISLEKEEAMMASLATKGQRSRLQQSRQGTRGKTPGVQSTALSPLNGIMGLHAATLASNEMSTFRTEDYEDLASDVVLLGKHGELLVGENCFVVEQKQRQELLLDLHTRGVVQPRIQIVRTPKLDEECTSAQKSSGITQQKPRSPPPPLRPPAAPSHPKREIISSASEFGGEVGSFESTPILAFDLQATPLAKGVALKLSDGLAGPAATSNNGNTAPRKTSKNASIPESVLNATLEPNFNALIKAPDAELVTAQSDSVLQTRQRLPEAAPPLSVLNIKPSAVTKSTGGESPVLPKHIHNGEKHLQSLRIRTPACPNRLPRKTPSRGSMFIGNDDEYVEDADSLFSLHKQHSSTNSLPNVKYVREFPKLPPGRIQLYGSVTQDTGTDRKLPTPSPMLSSPILTNLQHKR